MSIQKFYLCIQALVLLGCISFDLQAQNNWVQSVDTSGREQVLDNLVISATRFLQTADKLSQSVQRITSKRVNDLSPGTMADLLSQSGLAYVQKSQLGGGSPVIRGFEANKVLLVVDGIRMNNAIYRGGHLQNILTVDPYSLERVEVLQGPSSVMYGSDALGGVIHMRTKSLSFSNQTGWNRMVHAMTRFGSAAGETTVHGDMELAGSSFASFSSISVSDFGDLRQGRAGHYRFPAWGMRPYVAERIGGKDSMVQNDRPYIQKGTAYRQMDLLQKFMFKTGSWQHEWNLQFSGSSDVPRYDRLSETNASGKPKQAQWYYGPAQRSLISYRAIPKPTQWFDQGNIILAYQYQGESRHNRSFGSSKLNHRFEKVQAYSLNADFLLQSKKAEWRYGLEAVLNKVRSTAHYDQIVSGEQGVLDTRYPGGGSGTNAAALYTGYTRAMGKKITWDAGVRVSYQILHAVFEDKTFFPFPFHSIRQRSWVLTGSTGMVWHPSGQWIIKAHVSNGYRSPNVDDLAKVFESNQNNLIIPNPSLKPEKTINTEASVSFRPMYGIEISVATWLSMYRQVLTLGPGKLNDSSSVLYNGNRVDVMTTLNASKARLWGWEAHARAQLSKVFDISADITHTKGRFLLQQGTFPLDHIPPMYGNLALHFKKGKYASEIGVLFQSAKDSSEYKLGAEDNELYSADPVRGFTPAWQVMNLRQSFDLNRHIRIHLACENVFDRFYRVFSSGISAPGRNWVAGIQCRF